MKRKAKMTKEAAEALLYGAQHDLKFGQMPDNLLAYFVEKFGFFPYQSRIQVMLGQKNRLACNAFWDGNHDRVVYFLRAYGLEGNYYNPKAPPGNEMQVDEYRLSGKISTPQHDWKYVK
jgi:hypothetical protein